MNVSEKAPLGKPTRDSRPCAEVKRRDYNRRQVFTRGALTYRAVVIQGLVIAKRSYPKHDMLIGRRKAGDDGTGVVTCIKWEQSTTLVRETSSECKAVCLSMVTTSS
jgi:hypothetical protein